MRLSEEKRLIYISDSQETAPWQEGVQKESGGEVSVIRISSTEDLTAVFRENPSCFVLEDVGQDRDSIRQRIQKIRQHDRWVPIIVLLNTMVAERRLEVYRDGADGYICHPFYPLELLYLLRALLCRRGSSSGEKKVRLRDATVDIGTAQVIRGEKVTRLTGREFKIFLILLEKAGEIVTVRELCMALCGEHWEGYESTLLTHIYHIREKIEEKPSVPVSLITIKGLGYQLNILDKE